MTKRTPSLADPTTRARELRSTAGLASALRPALLRLARKLRRMRDDSDELSSSQLSVMGALLNDGDQPMTALAARESVRPPSMTRTVNDLEHRGLVRRTDNPEDRRQALVSLTAQGRATVLAIRKRRDDWLARRLAALDPAEREILRKAVPILEKVNRS